MKTRPEFFFFVFLNENQRDLEQKVQKNIDGRFGVIRKIIIF